jgi:ATP-dependent helicase Lhr and Lhr-like helicase
MTRKTVPRKATGLDRVLRWFVGRNWTPFAFQLRVWRDYARGRSGLIHATTGTGKTYAAFLGAVIEWLDEAAPLPPASTTNDETGTAIPAKRSAARQRAAKRAAAIPLRVLWVTPLRALAADTEVALRKPLDELELPWSVERRTGDTSASVRSLQRQQLPSVLIITPESLSLLLTHADASERLRDLKLIVVDEWHELLASKRGTQTELALARVRKLCPQARTWGLTATLGNLDVALQVLLGRPRPSNLGSASPPNLEPPIPTADGWLIDALPGELIEGEIEREYHVETLIPDSMERFPWGGHLGLKMLQPVVEAIDRASTSLVFTNTRWQTEMWYQSLLKARPDWAGLLALHHGSLDQPVRLWVEEGLRTGKLKAVVCTSSLDLGVDFAPVDQVIQIGSPKGVARLLQRAGRSGHQPGVTSKLVCVPTSALELIEFAAAKRCLFAGEIEGRTPIDRPLDLLAQHAVTLALGTGYTREEFLDEARSTWAYRGLTESELDWVLDFITRGGEALRAYPEYRRVDLVDGVYRVTSPDIARRHRMSLGTIVSETQIQVVYVTGGRLGTVEESFISRLKPGDVFTFAGKCLELVRFRDLQAQVRRSKKKTGPIPHWAGSRMPFSTELAAAVRYQLEEAQAGRFGGPEMERVRGLIEIQTRWSRLPVSRELLIERLNTREGQHLFFFPMEGRLVHEGLSALFAYRLARIRPITFSMSVNDYGFELLSAEPSPIEEALAAGLLSTEHLARDILASLNSVEMAKRQFREIARVAGLIFQGFPGANKTVKQQQVSSGLLFDVFTDYDPGNLLLHQAQRQVLEYQLEQSRLSAALERLGESQVLLVDVPRPTPLAFPLMVDMLRERLSTEKLGDRVRKMQVALEAEADAPKPPPKAPARWGRRRKTAP